MSKTTAPFQSPAHGDAGTSAPGNGNDVPDRDEDAVCRLMDENQSLVLWCANRLAADFAAGAGSGARKEFVSECAQAGVAGLRRAAEKFDETRGCKFSTYAVPWILKTARAAAVEWADARRAVSLDEAVCSPGGDDGATRGDFLPDESAEDPSASAERTLLGELVRRELARLPPRDRAMVEMKFGFLDGEPRTLAEIGAAFGVSTARAGRVLQRALDRLRPRLSVA